jgi:MFS family permease
MPNEERPIIFFTAAAHFFAHFYVLVFPPLVMPISRDLGLPIGDVVNLSFTMYLLFGLTAIGWGFLSKKIGHKTAMASGVILAGGGMLLAGFAPALSASTGLLAFALALVGIGCGSYHPCGTALITQSVTRRGRALGVIGMWGNVGIAIVPFTVGLLNFFIGWQRGIIILGAAGVALGLSMFLVPLSVNEEEDKINLETLKKGHAGKLFIIFLFAFLFSGLMYRSFTVTLPAYLENQLGNITAAFRNFVQTRNAGAVENPAFNTLTANLIATGIYVIGIAGQLVGGKIADKVSLKWAYLIFYCIAGVFLLGMALFSNWMLILFSGLFIFFILGLQPIENSLVAFLTPPKWRSVSYGIKFTIAFGIGSFAVKIIGWTEKIISIDQIMWMVLAFLAATVIVLIIFQIAGRGSKIDQKIDRNIETGL